MTRRKLSLGYKIFVIISLTTGIMLNIMKTTSIKSILSYYTLQSNIICLVAFVCFAILEYRKKPYKEADIYYLVKGAITIAIFITAFIYTFALAPGKFEMDSSLQNAITNKAIANLLVHTVSPILVILDYFLFDEKGRFKSYYPALWLVIPLNYLLYVYGYSYAGGEFYNIGGSKHYAYFFLDYEKIGYIGVAKWILIMTLFILVVSWLLVLVDSKLKKKEEL